MLYEGLLLGSLLFNPVSINCTSNYTNTLITTNIYDFQQLDSEIRTDIYLYVVNDSDTNIGDIGLDFNIVVDGTLYSYVYSADIFYGSDYMGMTKFEYYDSESSILSDGLYVSKSGDDVGTDFTTGDIYITIPYQTSDSVVEGITDGIGLLSPITNEFLNSFTAIFWDSTANDGEGALTTFSSFALTFLGVSITFAVVKLALNLIRGKTGA